MADSKPDAKPFASRFRGQEVKYVVWDTEDQSDGCLRAVKLLHKKNQQQLAVADQGTFDDERAAAQLCFGF